MLLEIMVKHMKIFVKFGARLSVVVAAVLLAACDVGTDKEPGQNLSVDQGAEGQKVVNPKIHWFDGSVEEGFALAKETNKPVYLYWGAVWCPPCQEIKHTVFKSKQFIAQTELFVPIYLDGDTDRAQAWGDKFGVKGYPTMIIFNPTGDEVTRIPGGIDISRYNSILELSLNEMRPTSMLVELALSEPESLQESDFVQLAYYSWGQDSGSLPEGTPATFFADLADISPDVEASARLYMEYLLRLADEQDEAKTESDLEPEPREVSANSRGAYDRISSILKSPELVLACWETFGYYAEEIIGLDIFSVDEKEKLKVQWQDQLLVLRTEPSLSTAEQLAGWLPMLNFHFMADSDAPLSEKTIAALKADISKADEKTSNSFARQSVVSQMNYLYQSAKLYDDAKVMLLAELDRSEYPYYFMSSLSSLAEKEDNITEALEWRRKAYEASTGGATRLQWGANYVRTIIRLTPENHELIMATSTALFNDLSSEKEFFAGRNFRILRSLVGKMAEWQEQQDEKALASVFQSRIQLMCNNQAADTLERDNCESLSQQG